MLGDDLRDDLHDLHDNQVLVNPGSVDSRAIELAVWTRTGQALGWGAVVVLKLEIVGCPVESDHHPYQKLEKAMGWNQ